MSDVRVYQAFWLVVEHDAYDEELLSGHRCWVMGAFA